MSRRLITVSVLVILLAGCGGRPGGAGAAGQRPTPTVVTSAEPSVERLVQQAIEAFDRTAGGPVAAQQAELRALLASGQRTTQDSCPAATSTVAFEPVYPRLAPSPNWRPNGGALGGVVYALPTLIRIYTGDRVTGTDLTDLHVAVDAGRAWLPALCLN